MANDIFRDLLDVCLIIYLDDLLVYSKTQEEHDSHVQLVLKRLREHGLYAKLEKCIPLCPMGGVYIVQEVTVTNKE